MNVLIFGVGGPTSLGIAKSLKLSDASGVLRLVGVDGDRFAPGLYRRDLFDATYLNGFASDAGYWDIVEAIVERECIDVAYVVPEGEVLAWARRQSTHDLPCLALIPDSRVALSMYDKKACHGLLRDTGLVPETIEVDDIRRATDLGAQLGYPYWIRKSEGAGALGAFRIERDNDLKHWLSLNPSISGLIASPFLPGRNFACKVLYQDGALVRAACGERIDYLLAKSAPSGVSGMCARGRLINNAGLIDRSDRAVRSIFEHHGVVPRGMFTVDFKEDHAGVPWLTEINIRHVSFTHAFSLGGANFALDTLHLLVDGSLDEPDYKTYEFDDEPFFIRGVDSEIFIVTDRELVR